MSVTKSKTSDLSYAHEDECDYLMNSFTTPDICANIFIIRSPDDECFFASTTPITVERITEEFPDGYFCINDTIEQY